MNQPSTKPDYKEDDLKVKVSDKKKTFSFQEEEEPPVKREMTSLEGVKTVLLLLFGYAITSILPIWLLMKFANTGFVLSHGIFIVVVLAIVFGFGLHKPASPEQLAKRDRRKRKN